MRKEWFHLRNLIVATASPILQDFLAPAEFLLRIVSKICINIYNSSTCPQGEKDEIEKKNVLLEETHQNNLLTELKNYRLTGIKVKRY